MGLDGFEMGRLIDQMAWIWPGAMFLAIGLKQMIKRARVHG